MAVIPEAMKRQREEGLQEAYKLVVDTKITHLLVIEGHVYDQPNNKVSQNFPLKCKDGVDARVQLHRNLLEYGQKFEEQGRVITGYRFGTVQWKEDHAFDISKITSPTS